MPAPAPTTDARDPWRVSIGVVSAAWLLSIGFDLLLHGGLLARFYVRDSPFLLPPAEAFRRVPLGYAAFLLAAAALYWLLTRLEIRGAVAGARAGLVTGALVWGTWVLGLFSIATADGFLLLSWWVGQSIELGLAGAVIGAAAAGEPLFRLWRRTVLAVLLFVIVTVVLQSTGWAPAQRIAS